MRCRDALDLDIVCRVLSQSYPGGHHSRPAYVYSDFQCGCPAYFDLSVHSATQFLYSVLCWGCCYSWEVSQAQDAVEEAWCNFIPLVVEAFVCALRFPFSEFQTSAR